MKPETRTVAVAPGPAPRCKVWLWFSMMLLLAAIPCLRGEEPHYVFQPTSPEPLASNDCPPSCSNVFARLDEGRYNDDRKVQTVHVQERGEPKSGTGFMFEWGMGALAHACMYLQRAYGEESCRIEWSFFNRTLIFEPDRVESKPGPCSCDDVEMVTITLTNEDKHTLPVHESCGYSHLKGIGTHGQVCTPPSGGNQSLENYLDVYRCARESACETTDDRLQMAVMRDPRPVAVSAYFHVLRTRPEIAEVTSLGNYVLRYLPTFCQWLTIRYFLFAKVLEKTSQLFWYDDAKDSPEGWHDAFYELVALRLPASVKSKAVDVAVGRASDNRFSYFPSRGIDVHLGQKSSAAPSRSFRDEISPEMLSQMDAVLRVWLPPALLQKLRVESA